MTSNGLSQINSQAIKELLAGPPMGIVVQPTLSVYMAGHLRLQVPCSKENQMLFDLMHPDAKLDPGKRLEIKTEAGQWGQQAAALIGQTMQNSPQLRPVTTKIGCSYA